MDLSDLFKQITQFGKYPLSLALLGAIVIISLHIYTQTVDLVIIAIELLFLLIFFIFLTIFNGWWFLGGRPGKLKMGSDTTKNGQTKQGKSSTETRRFALLGIIIGAGFGFIGSTVSIFLWAMANKHDIRPIGYIIGFLALGIFFYFIREGFKILSKLKK